MTVKRTVLLACLVLLAPSYLHAVTVRETRALRLSQGVSETLSLRATDRISGSTGEARVTAKAAGMDIQVQLDDMKPATLFGGDYNTYILWAISPEGAMQNLGEFILEGDRSRLHASTDLHTFGIVVTAEPHYVVTLPSAFVVFEITPDRPVATIRYPVFEGLYNFERSRLSNVKEAKGRVLTEVKQAFTAFQLAQRAGAEELAGRELMEAERSLDQIAALLHAGITRNEIAALARETVRLAVAAQRLAQDRAFSALESKGKAREEETAWAEPPVPIRSSTRMRLAVLDRRW